MFEAMRTCVRNSGVAAGVMMLAAGAAWADTTMPKVGPGFVQPDYPRNSEQAYDEGEVIVDMCVAASGAVESAAVFKSSGNRTLDEATVASFKASRFEPGTEDGKPVRVCGYKLTMAWNKENAPAPTR